MNKWRDVIIFKIKYGKYIREDKMDIDVKLSSEDDKLSDIYALIKRTVIEAPIKYDEIIKKRGFINLVVSMGTGLIPAIILVSLLLTVEEVREIFMTTYVTYPIAVLIVGLGIGTFVSSIMLSSKYSRIEPEKKSKGWDSNGKRIYVDDTEDYISKSEILIGKNKNNLECRDYIKRTYARFKTFFLIELLIIGILSVIVVGMGMMD